MSGTLSQWAENVLTRRRVSIAKPVGAVGAIDKHLGPRWVYAEIEVIAEPASEWSVEVELPDTQRLELARLGYLREAIFGFLDVLVTRPEQPLLNIRMRIVAARADPVRSNPHAFRMAGRAAAEGLLAATTA